MLVKEVDGVCLETLEAGVDDPLDVIGTAVEQCPLATVIGIGFKAEFGCDDDVLSEGSKGFAYDFFVQVRTVDLGGIEKGDPTLNGGADELDGFRLFCGGAEAEAQAHATEAEC